MEDMVLRTGMELSHISYKGSADLMQALLGEETMIEKLGLSKPQS
jgi:tripartite-type tricarboxylate transporter receptor subunit TctC